MKNKRFLAIVLFSISVCAMAQPRVKTYDSYKGLIMAGYQGWFNAPDDGAGRGWHHYSGKDGFMPGSCTIDLWPDVTEYEKLYPTDFVFSDGSPAYTFSSYDATTVDTHFRWMREYGLDGVFMQRFITEIRTQSGKQHFNKVLFSAMKSANKYGRAICLMYDLSGMNAGEEQLLLGDIDELANTCSIRDRIRNPSYLYHNGKPLVAVWGVGFNDHRQYGLKEVELIIDGLKRRGFSIMLGVPAYWRTLSEDTSDNVELHRLIKKCDILMPWFVGRYNEESYPLFRKLIQEDIIWAGRNAVDYVPLAFPGFSWRNMKGYDTVQISRNKGSFLWSQLVGALSCGAEMIYVAMFDEIDEGTAIFKCASRVPVGKSVFVPIEEGIESDYYLWLVGKAGKMLRKEQALSPSLPKE